jgi:hypothetical protein
MNLFLQAYRKGVNAKKTLAGMDALHEPEAKPVAAPSRPPAPAAASKAAGATPVADAKDWKASKTCFFCGKTGHIKPDCPEKKKAEARGVKMGVLQMAMGRRDGPYLAMDLSAEEQGPTMRLMAYMDSGAEGDAVGQNWRAHLELHGGQVERLETPVVVEWLDKRVQREVTEAVRMRVQVAGCDIAFYATFLVVPWDIDHLVIGWPSMRANGILARLEDLLTVQSALGVATGMGATNDNQQITDLDGQVVMTDDFLWPDEKSASPEPETTLSAAQQREVDHLLHEYAVVFEDKPAGSAAVEPMVVRLKPGWVPPPLEPFRKYSPRVEAALKMDLQKQLDEGVIEVSESTYGCPVHAVPKPDSESGYRFCIDFRPLNAGVVTDPYPLPTVGSVLASLAGCVFFAKMDLRSGYWQFPVHPESRGFLAFFLWGVMYQYRVVAMGFVDSSFFVQRTMYRLFSKKFGRGVLVYLDDIIIYARTFAEFLELLSFVLSVLREASLVCKRAKCFFGLKEIHILGHVVSKDGVWMHKGRIDDVLEVPFPRNARELRRFLGMTNYMRNFIPNYSSLAKPLSCQVNNPVAEWPRTEMERAFAEVKRATANQLSLTHLDYEVPIVVQSDASVLGVGGCLINRYPDGDRVVGCVSHAFTEAESRWKTIEQEAFAIVYILIFFRAVLWGHNFLVETDHRNLTFIHSGTSAKLSRWSLLLQSMSFAVSYLPGEKNVVADALSRAPRGMRLGLLAVRLADFCASTLPIRLGAMQGVEPSDSERRTWFDEVHNDTMGHFGVHATLRALQSAGKLWSRMSREIAQWIAECPTCQKYRLGGKEVVAIPSPIASFQIFEELGVDFIGPLPKDDVGNSYICNCVCSTTHYCELFAVEAATAVIAAHCLLSVVARYGCFRRVRSDRGTHFVNEIIAEFMRLFEIQQVLTLAERPQANAIVERNGGEVVRHLRALVAQRDLRSIWSVMLPLSQRIINKTWKASIMATPHQLMHWAPTDLDRGILTPYGEAQEIPPLSTEFVSELQRGYERLLDETSEHVAREQEKLRVEFKSVVPTVLEVGSLVLMSYLVRPPSKLAARWAGPFRILAREANSATLEDLTGGAQKIVDVSRLKPFLLAPGVDPQAVAAADMGEAQVESVLAHKGSARQRATLEFQIQWSDGDVTWEPWASVRKLAAVDDYIRAFPGPSLRGLLK